MKNRFFVIVLFLLFAILSNEAHSQQLKHILVFSKTVGGYRHVSIAAGKEMVLRLGKQFDFKVDTTENASFFTDKKLADIDVVVFLSTRGDVLDAAQQVALQQYIRAGGGFLGIHAATTTEYDWPWYNQLIGAYFDGHPEPQTALYLKADSTVCLSTDLPDSLRWKDEIYNFKSVQDSLHYILLVDEKSYTGGSMGETHPVAWRQYFEGGRVFYFGPGHFDQAYQTAFFEKTIYNGLRWCAGIDCLSK